MTIKKSFEDETKFFFRVAGAANHDVLITTVTTNLLFRGAETTRMVNQLPEPFSFVTGRHNYNAFQFPALSSSS
jgi:hypothetical protein